MKISEQIKQIAKHRDITITELANNIGTSQANLANKLVRDNFKLSDIQEIIKGLNYDRLDLVLRGNDETVIIGEDVDIVVFPKNNKFSDKDIATEDDDNTTFRKLLFEIIEDLFEPELQKAFGNTLDARVPGLFKEEFKIATKESLYKLGIGKPLNHAKRQHVNTNCEED